MQYNSPEAIFYSHKLVGIEPSNLCRESAVNCTSSRSITPFCLFLKVSKSSSLIAKIWFAKKQTEDSLEVITIVSRDALLATQFRKTKS